MAELEERRFLVSGAQGDAALAKIRQSLRVAPLGDSGQEMRLQVVANPLVHHSNVFL